MIWPPQRDFFSLENFLTEESLFYSVFKLPTAFSLLLTEKFPIFIGKIHVYRPTVLFSYSESALLDCFCLLQRSFLRNSRTSGLSSVPTTPLHCHTSGNRAGLTPRPCLSWRWSFGMGPQQHLPVRGVCARQIECRGRSPEQTGTDTTHRMDHSSGRPSTCLGSMGPTRDRSVRDSPHEQTTEIRVSNLGSPCRVVKRILQVLDEPPPVCIPTHRSDTQSSGALSHRSPTSRPDNTILAGQAMVAGAGPPLPRGASPPQPAPRSAAPTRHRAAARRTAQPQPDRMATMRTGLRAQNVTVPCANAILDSRRSSTTKMYPIRWLEWFNFCLEDISTFSRLSIRLVFT